MKDHSALMVIHIYFFRAELSGTGGTATFASPEHLFFLFSIIFVVVKINFLSILAKISKKYKKT